MTHVPTTRGLRAVPGLEPLHPAVLRLWRWEGAVATVVALGILGAIFHAPWWTVDAPQVEAALLAAVGVEAVVQQGWFIRRRFVAAGYRVDEHGVTVAHGRMFRVVRTVPRTQIMHVEIKRDPRLGRDAVRLGVGVLQERLEIHALPLGRAEELRDALVATGSGERPGGSRAA